MTAAYLPEAMTMTSTMPSAAARKDITKPPVPKVRIPSTPAPTTVIISKNVFPPVRVITSPVKSLTMASAKTVTENMLPAKKTPNAPAKRKIPITQTLVITALSSVTTAAHTIVLTVPAAMPAPVTLTPQTAFPTVIFRTENLASVVTD